MNYYPHHIGDFRSGSIHMTRIERWIYRDMIEVYYDTEKPLPLNVNELCHIIGARSEDDRKIVAELLQFKFEKTEDGFRKARCDDEIAAYRAKAETAKSNGRMGGRPSKAKANPEEPSGFRSGSNPVAAGNPGQTGSQTNQEPRTNNQEPRTNSETTARAMPSASLDLLGGIPAQLAIDFKKLRSKKNAPITPTAIEGMRREAAKAGITLEAALTMCCERGWSGFKADWVEAHSARQATPQADTAAVRKAVNDEAKRRLFGNRSMNAEGIIDV
ncbi:MAG: YdaU family protein [Aeromicrobium sp.]|nr:YdaU family protein [Burkholderiales bacterium]